MLELRSLMKNKLYGKEALNNTKMFQQISINIVGQVLKSSANIIMLNAHPNTPLINTYLFVYILF